MQKQKFFSLFFGGGARIVYYNQQTAYTNACNKSVMQKINAVWPYPLQVRLH